MKNKDFFLTWKQKTHFRRRATSSPRTLSEKNVQFFPKSARAESAQRCLYQESLELYHSGKLSQAIAKLEKSIALDPKFLDGLEMLGVLYAKVDHLDDAIEMMKRLAKISPNHTMAHANLSRFYVQKGMILEAEQEQAEARRLSWKAELKAQKGVEEFGRTTEEEAQEQKKEITNRIERYKKVIELDPHDVLGYFSLGSAYLEARELHKARQAFEKAIEVDPNHSPSFFNLGLTLESLNLKQEAIQIYERGIKIADEKGDMIPLKKMEARLQMLRSENQGP
jgi:tetratricopeptide (TPR) repeat protein